MIYSLILQRSFQTNTFWCPNCSHPTKQKLSNCISIHPDTYIYTFKHLPEVLYTTWVKHASKKQIYVMVLLSNM